MSEFVVDIHAHYVPNLLFARFEDRRHLCIGKFEVE